MKQVIYISGTYNVTQDTVLQLLKLQPEDRKIPDHFVATMDPNGPEWQEIRPLERHTGILLDSLDTDRLGRKDQSKLERIYKVTIEDSGECSIEKVN